MKGHRKAACLTGLAGGRVAAVAPAREQMPRVRVHEAVLPLASARPAALADEARKLLRRRAVVHAGQRRREPVGGERVLHCERQLLRPTQRGGSCSGDERRPGLSVQHSGLVAGAVQASDGLELLDLRGPWLSFERTKGQAGFAV